MLPELCAGAEGAGALDATCDSGCCDRGCEIGALGRDAARDEVVGAFAIAGSRLTGGAGTSGRAGFGISGEITPSDSVTGDAGETGDAGDAGRPLASPASRASLASLV